MAATDPKEAIQKQITAISLFARWRGWCVWLVQVKNCGSNFLKRPIEYHYRVTYNNIGWEATLLKWHPSGESVLTALQRESLEGEFKEIDSQGSLRGGRSSMTGKILKTASGSVCCRRVFPYSSQVETASCGLLLDWTRWNPLENRTLHLWVTFVVGLNTHGWNTSSARQVWNAAAVRNIFPL